MSPQSISAAVDDSLTMNLSFGLLPVRNPVVTVKAPFSAKTPSFCSSAFMINSSFESFNFSTIFLIKNLVNYNFLSML